MSRRLHLSEPSRRTERASRSLRESCVTRVVLPVACIYCGEPLTKETAVPCVHGWTCATCIDEMADDERRQRNG